MICPDSFPAERYGCSLVTFGMCFVAAVALASITVGALAYSGMGLQQAIGKDRGFVCLISGGIVLVLDFLGFCCYAHPKRAPLLNKDAETYKDRLCTKEFFVFKNEDDENMIMIRHFNGGDEPDSVLYANYEMIKAGGYREVSLRTLQTRAKS